MQKTVQEKVPQLIDIDKIIRLELPGERVERMKEENGLLAFSTTRGDERIFRAFGMRGARISGTLAFQDKDSLKLIFKLDGTSS